MLPFDEIEEHLTYGQTCLPTESIFSSVVGHAIVAEIEIRDKRSGLPHLAVGQPVPNLFSLRALGQPALTQCC
jgi:hypothetical protein